MNKFETSSYKTIKSALVNRNLKQALYDEGKVIMDGVLLTLHGEEHRKRRKLEHRVFQRDFFKYYEQELFPKTLNETINPFLKKVKGDFSSKFRPANCPKTIRKTYYIKTSTKPPRSCCRKTGN